LTDISVGFTYNDTIIPAQTPLYKCQSQGAFLDLVFLNSSSITGKNALPPQVSSKEIKNEVLLGSSKFIIGIYCFHHESVNQSIIIIIIITTFACHMCVCIY
jgi:hypothetical protein